MNMGSSTRDPAQGWSTMCGGHTPSECIAYRTVPNPSFGGLTEDGRPEPEFLVELGNSEGQGGTFTVHPHELDQLVAGYTRGDVDEELVAAVRADLRAHPELTPSDPFMGPQAA
jgi:hypothetical protein